MIIIDDAYVNKNPKQQQHSSKPFRYIWRDAVLSEDGPPNSTTRLVLIGLESFMNEHGCCFPSISSIASRIALSERAVGIHLKRTRGEWIKISNFGKSKGWARHQYMAILPDYVKNGVNGAERESAPSDFDADSHSVPPNFGTDPYVDGMELHAVDTDPDDTLVPNSDRTNNTNNNTNKNTRNQHNKTSLPKKFPLTQEMIEYAQLKGVSDLEVIQSETEGFLLYHESKGSRFSNWLSAWKNWIRNYIKFNKKNFSQDDNQPHVPDFPK